MEFHKVLSYIHYFSAFMLIMGIIYKGFYGYTPISSLKATSPNVNLWMLEV